MRVLRSGKDSPPEIHKCRHCGAVCEVDGTDWHTVAMDNSGKKHNLSYIAAGKWWKCPECKQDVTWSIPIQNFRQPN